MIRPLAFRIYDRCFQYLAGWTAGLPSIHKRYNIDAVVMLIVPAGYANEWTSSEERSASSAVQVAHIERPERQRLGSYNGP